MKQKILLVEDDENLGFMIEDQLQLEGFQVDWQKGGEDGLDAFVNGQFDCCVFDVMLPQKDGFTLAQEIRKTDKKTPILFLTAKSLDEDMIKGFQIGGDDYVTKPFNMDVLVLRIQSLLKRSSEQKELQEEYQLGKYLFKVSDQLLVCPKTEDRKLTNKETAILQLLCAYRNEVLPRDLALRMIWGESDYFKGRSMDVYLTKLRKYLSEDSGIEIENHHGVGFKLVVSTN